MLILACFAHGPNFTDCERRMGSSRTLSTLIFTVTLPHLLCSLQTKRTGLEFCICIPVFVFVVSMFVFLYGWVYFVRLFYSVSMNYEQSFSLFKASSSRLHKFSSRVALIVRLPLRLTSIWIISSQFSSWNSSNFLKLPQISSPILYFLPALLAGWKN